jgi:hypothetical protein
MCSSGTRLSLALLALTASLAVARAQTSDPHHPASQVSSPQATMPTPDTAAHGGQRGDGRGHGTHDGDDAPNDC